MKDPILSPLNVDKGQADALRVKFLSDMAEVSNSGQPGPIIFKAILTLIKIHESFIERLDKVNDVIKNNVGPKGDKPSQEELVTLIESLIPTVEEEKLLSLIEPLIPEVEDGETPSEEYLVSLIKPLIPEIKAPQVISRAEIKAMIREMLPKINYEAIAERASKKVKPTLKGKIMDRDLPNYEVFIEELLSGKLKKKMSIDSVDGLRQTIIAFEHQLGRGKGYLHGSGVPKLTAGSGITLVPLDGGGFQVVNSGALPTIYTETPSGLINGTNKVYTTVHAIGTVFSLMINGEYLHPVTDFSYTGNTITLIAALDASLSGKPFTIIYA